MLPEVKERRGGVEVVGYRGDLAVEARPTAGGAILIDGISLAGFRLVRVPRIWDNLKRREAERDAGGDLDRLARRFKRAIDEWTASVAELATWLRCLPPPPGAALRAGPGLEHEDTDVDEEPHSTH